MKDTLMIMVGAAAGIGAYLAVEAISKDKNNVKKKMNTLIDDTAKLMK